MNRKLIAVLAATTMVGAVGFSAIASAEATVYGRVVAGVVHNDGDTDDDGALDLGATGQEGTWQPGSRLGVRGSIDLGNGAEAGFQIERGIESATTKQRYNNVYLSGGWGKLTIGQQGNNYNAARNWDQTNYLGGEYEIVSSRTEGIGYAMSSGPFSFSVMATGNDASKDAEVDPFEADGMTASDATEVAASGATHGITLAAHGTAETDSDDGVDSWIIQAGYDLGVVNLNFAHYANNDDMTIVEPTSTGTLTPTGGVTDAVAQAAVVTAQEGARDAAREKGERVVDGAATRSGSAIGVNGSVGSLDWYLAYQTSELNSNAYENDVDSIGGFLGFKVSERDTLYGYHVQHSADRVTADLGEDYSESVFGYSRNIGPGINFAAEYRTLDLDLESGAEGDSPTRLVLAVKVDF